MEKNEVQIGAFANYSDALIAKKLVKIDYSQMSFSNQPLVLSQMGLKLGKIAKVIEKTYEGKA